MMAMLCYRNEQVVRAVNQGLTDAHRSETLLWSDSAKQGLMLRYIYVAVRELHSNADEAGTTSNTEPELNANEAEECIDLKS